MKGILVIAGLVSTVIAASAVAVPADHDYNGEVKGDPYPGSSIAFDLDRLASGHRKVKRVIASGLAFDCEGGSSGETSGVSLAGGFRVDDDGKFGGRTDATILGFDPPARLRGELRPHRKAVGTLRVHGELDPNGQPGVDCDTGVQEWKATKGARTR